jgi:hypothetical protein
MSTHQLETLISEGRQYGAEYQGGLSSHLPMSLIALHQLGASDSRLVEFHSAYVERLETKNEPSAPFTCNNWREALGQHRANSEYVAFFERELDRLGQHALLKTWLPTLFPGVSGGAFHPLIRLGYALEMEHDAEIVEALASWAMAFLDLGLPRPPVPESPKAALKRLASNDFLRNFRPEGKNIFNRLAAIAARPEFDDYGALEAGTSLNDVREAALQIYTGSNSNFTGLHIVTVAHAFRRVGEFLGSIQSEWVDHLWRGACAAYVSISMPELIATPPETRHTWDTIHARARTNRDPHVIKFVYSCYQESLVYKDDRYRPLAAARVKLSDA